MKQHKTNTELIAKSLKRRHRKQIRLKYYGLFSVLLGISFLLILLGSITINGYTAFQQTVIKINVKIDENHIFGDDGKVSEDVMYSTNWDGLAKKAFRKIFPEVTERFQQRKLSDLISANSGYDIQQMMIDDPSLVGREIEIWVNASDDVDQLIKGRLNVEVPEDQRRINDMQLAWIQTLKDKNILKKTFNSGFFTSADSREPESSGILGAILGSAMAMVVTMFLALPFAVMAAIYLEYFAKPGKLTDFIEVNINNLAAVPSIVFGLLGLAVFLNFFQLPRSAPLVGGMVLALMTLPTIIIASRASIRAVPPSIRDAALGLGASKMQAAVDHVLPLASPGILTGTIIGMAQALGETAPLIMIGMVVFLVDIPTGFTDTATALPVQIYIWSDSAERAFYERSSLAIMFLVLFLIGMNLLAVLLRKKFEKKW